MPSTAHRSAMALVVSVCTLLAAAVLSAPGVLADPNQSQASSTQAKPTQTSTPAAGGQATCTNRSIPPEPADDAEHTGPDETPPAPLPVPEPPIGGARMGECGAVLPAGTTAPEATKVNAASWLIADVSTGAVVAAKDPHARHRPAALIKVLTAYVALQELGPTVLVSVTKEDTEQEGGTVLTVGKKKYTVKDLVHVMMLTTGNDAASALARQLGGVDATVDKMNKLANRLGALDTRAATPTGLDGPGMTTSAYDTALIFRAAMNNTEFAKAAAATQYLLPGKQQINNTNKLLSSNYTKVLAAKSGITDNAKQTFVGAAEKNGRKLMVVMLRAEKSPQPSLELSRQASVLLNFGFEQKAGAESVGQLVDGKPVENNKPVAAVPSGQGKQDTGSSDQQPGGGPVNVAANEMTAFGTVGAPLTIAAGALVFVGLLLYLRKRRAKLVRARRTQAQAQA